MTCPTPPIIERHGKARLYRVKCTTCGKSSRWGDDLGRARDELLGKHRDTPAPSDLAEERLWSCGKSEELCRRSVREAVLDCLRPTDPSEWPEALTVYAFRRMRPDVQELYEPIDDVLERLDEEYGDPLGNGPGPTPKMLEAQGEFLGVVAREYRAWACEIIEDESIEINVREWVAINAPGLVDQ